MSKETRDIAIRVSNLRKEFTANDGTRVTILDDVTFDVYAGETVVVMGGSGSGKSTVLNCLIGEYTIDGGSIVMCGQDINSLDEQGMNDLRQKFGILFQSGALFNSMSVAENVALPLREHSPVDPSVIDIVVTMKLEQVRMLPHRDKFPSQLSGGQKKRAGLARAIALDPQILFYDEPSAGLDPVTSAAIDELMMDLSRRLGVTSVVVTHEMDSAFRIADRMVMLYNGRILRVGTREQFDRLRNADPDSLTDFDDQLIHQFVTGSSTGPLTSRDGVSEYERLMAEG